MTLFVDIATPPTGTLSLFNLYIVLSQSSRWNSIWLLHDFNDGLLLRKHNSTLLEEDDRLANDNTKMWGWYKISMLDLAIYTVQWFLSSSPLVNVSELLNYSQISCWASIVSQHLLTCHSVTCFMLTNWSVWLLIWTYDSPSRLNTQSHAALPHGLYTIYLGI
jgi:hypothetical protein